MLIPLKALPFENIKGIIHVGAHCAEELEIYTECGVTDVLWIEASKARYEHLEMILAGHSGMHLGKFAAGESKEVGSMYVASNGQSSSLLMPKLHVEEYPHIKFTDNEYVDIRTVDSWIDENSFDRKRFNFLNLDIQGYELKALNGCKIQLAFVDYVYTEVNKKELYEGCARIQDLDRFLKGFGLRRVMTEMTTSGWGDALYARKMEIKELVKIHVLVLGCKLRSRLRSLYIHSERLVAYIKSSDKKCR